jgi:hypothetical protein
LAQQKDSLVVSFDSYHVVVHKAPDWYADWRATFDFDRR